MQFHKKNSVKIMGEESQFYKSQIVKVLREKKI